MIRTQEQVPAIEKLAGDNSDKLKVLVRNLANVESEEDAAAILHKVKPQMIVWSAGTLPTLPSESLLKLQEL